ncbi:MAG: hypothetical protein KAW92_12020 [Candidatus Cloacimonetes bacterium]|nr:hypothetical protein [Candidatus Cloacimonadota bacterium]
MGTQQILLVVLSVIIVGVAVAVGITMFGTQAENANRQAVLGDLQNFGSSAMGFYKTPTGMGGGGSGTPGFALAALCKYIGFTTGGLYSNDNGGYTLTRTSATVIKIVGLGTEVGQDGSGKVKATLTVTATNASPLATVIDN